MSEELMTAFLDSQGPVADFITMYTNMDVYVLDDDLRDVAMEHGLKIYERAMA